MARLLALALGATAASALTQDEAQCIAKFDGGQTFVWVGDSNMRYESLAFNEYLEQGTILSSLARNGDSGKGQIDDLTFWNRPPGYSPPAATASGDREGVPHRGGRRRQLRGRAAQGRVVR